MCVLMEFYRELCSDNKTADKTRQSHKYVISSSRSNCQRVGERQQVRTEFFFFFWQSIIALAQHGNQIFLDFCACIEFV